ncbi:MAG: glycosyltransferase [Vulcanococcus sp.]|jgi:GT2 family glycosyltransferase|uniref:glycosyltransferase n=1 Tax=Vulcanococcus sp. TaxID=2856995 RepID=UPI0025EBB7F0|nr:glycosyltransferase [Vulcanococcus sp.]MBW0180952.1 glycosyltransferase [Vulcanococcus sp.]
MHRSGTSLLGGVLQQLGVALPGEQIAADEHNPEGYFEWREVVDLQERLLIDLDRWWPSAQGCLPLPPNWRRHPATLVFRAELCDLLREERNRQQGPWAIKDPRTSCLLPFWLELADELDIPVRLLLAVRDPAEVAHSLIQRDGPITGMDLTRAQQLWWRHTLEPLQAAPPRLPRAVVDFGAWFTQPEQQLRELLQLIPELQPNPDQRRAALSLIRPEHRRSLAGAAALSLNPRVRRLHTQLQAGLAGRQRWPSPKPPRSLRAISGLPPSPAKLAADPLGWRHWLEVWRHHPAPRYSGFAAVAPQAVLSLCGTNDQHWSTHLWIHRLPLEGITDCVSFPESADPHNLFIAGRSAAGFTRLALNVELPLPERAQHWLTHLRGQQVIWDPEPARVLLLRALGLPAFWLDVAGPVSGWLSLEPAELQRLTCQLGFSIQTACTCLALGPGGDDWEHALAEAECRGAEASILYIPQLPLNVTADFSFASSFAAWLIHSAAHAEHVVVLASDSFAGDPALSCLKGRTLRLMPPPITPAELLEELRGRPKAIAEDRASADIDVLFMHDSGEQAQAAVLISLHNYADKIERALNSVDLQVLSALELVVVDDFSTDHSVETVLAWLGEHAGRFKRCCLIRHRANIGLAAARNTAFAHSVAPWAFVLDADNMLFPAAVQACLSQALVAPEAVAVIHPWVEVIGNGRYGHDGRSLIGRVSWQRDAFLGGNVIDAMALVRRSAWQAVGGYTHIQGGWEDFDFWCKLIEAGYCGLLCPRILARYYTHADSMTATSTATHWRSLSRCLQERHPWLRLPYSA